MGVVYEAFDKERGSVVALKALRDLSPERLFRFKREFRSFRDLNHPNLVNLHELHCDRDTWFFTMDLVEGEQLLRWTRPGGALDEGRVRACLEQLAMALLALHDGGKVHRDVKPSNVLVTKEGRVVLLDFGIATENLGRSTDAVLGTIAYMAPEQALGEAASPAADWYAVGVTLFEMLTGRLPINGSPYSMLLGKLNLPHPHPASIASGVPDDLDALCADLLSVRPSERPLGRAILERLQGRPLAPVDRQPFVGRDSELQDLAAEFQVRIPGPLEHRFRRHSSTDSDATRALIPTHSSTDSDAPEHY